MSLFENDNFLEAAKEAAMEIGLTEKEAEDAANEFIFNEYSSFWSDSVLFAIFGFIFYFVSNTKKAKLKGVSTAFIVLLVCLIISLGYLAKLYVRVRYIVFLYFHKKVAVRAWIPIPFLEGDN